MTWRWYEVCDTSELPPMAKLKACVNDFPLCLIHLAEGDLMACEDRCPHAGVSLADGGFVHPEDKTITCGAHLWCFELKDGSCLDFPHVRLKRYPVAEDAGKYWVGFWTGDDPDPLNG